ncbi:MAG: hypothetical protein NVSMB2_21190 [Chloroflexota bacterium]
MAPATIDVGAGAHRIAFESAAALGVEYALTTDGASASTFSPTLWRRQPVVQHIRAVVPGASLADVRVLADGDLALTVSAGRDSILQAWRLVPESGAVTELAPAWPGDRLVVSADATRIALIGRDVGPPQSASEQSVLARGRRVVWLGSTDQAAFTRAWRAPVENQEAVTDASWNPRADQVLIATTRRADAATGMSRLWLLDPGSLEARLILSLPSELVTGTPLWSPNGERIAFVAHGGTLNALCVLDTRDGQFRYLADLAPSSTTPLAYPVGVWSPDSEQFVYVAPGPTQANNSLAWPPPTPRPGLFMVRALDHDPELIGDVEASFPAWREDGQLLGIAQQPGTGMLQVRLIAAGHSRPHLVDIPVRPSASFAAVWDVPHAQILLAERVGVAVDLSLARLGLEALQ